MHVVFFNFSLSLPRNQNNVGSDDVKVTVFTSALHWENSKLNKLLITTNL